MLLGMGRRGKEERQDDFGQDDYFMTVGEWRFLLRPSGLRRTCRAGVGSNSGRWEREGFDRIIVRQNDVAKENSGMNACPRISRMGTNGNCPPLRGLRQERAGVFSSRLEHPRAFPPHLLLRHKRAVSEDSEKTWNPILFLDEHVESQGKNTKPRETGLRVPRHG